MGVHPLLTAGVTTAHLNPQRAAIWAAAVHQAIRESRGSTVGSMVEPGAGRSYYLVRVQLGDGTPLRLMLHAGVGVVAAAEDPGPTNIVAVFREVPRPDVFTLHGFHVANPDDMEEPLTGDQAVQLTEAERKEIVYHGASRVGDVIFNWFD